MPERLLSQLAHVEVLTPVPEESLRFYEDVMGLEVSAREGQSVYLRGWGDFFHHTLKLTESPEVGLGHVAWRADGPEQLTRAVERLEASGRGEGWVSGEAGHGDAYRYRTPHGEHLNEVFWEVERYVPPAELAPQYPNRPQRYVPRGAAVRSLDHVTVASPDILGDVHWMRDTLGHRFTEYIAVPRPHGPENGAPGDVLVNDFGGSADEFVVFGMTTTVHMAHDLALVLDPTDVRGRVNHVAFWVDQREELLRAADVLLDAGVAIEFGPGRHGMGEQDYVYVREPSGLRVELNAGGYRNWAPDWEPIRWTPQMGANSWYRNVAMPETMMESFPSVGPSPMEAVESGLFNATAPAEHR